MKWLSRVLRAVALAVVAFGVLALFPIGATAGDHCPAAQVQQVQVVQSQAVVVAQAVVVPQLFVVPSTPTVAIQQAVVAQAVVVAQPVVVQKNVVQKIVVKQQRNRGLVGRLRR